MAKTSGTLESYKASNKFGDTLKSQEERYQMAIEFYQASPRDLVSAKALFDRVEDVDHAGFLNLLGNICYLPESPYFDLEQSKSFFRRAYRYEIDEERKDIYAQNYLHAVWAQLPIKSYNGLEKDITAAEFLVRIHSKNKPFKFTEDEKSSSITKYAVALMAGSGNVFERDHSAAVSIYEDYLNEVSSGHLSSAYLNLSLRYALGLGVEKDLQKALLMLDLEYFLISDSRKYPACYEAIKRFSNNSENDLHYKVSADRILDNYRKKGHVYNLTSFWTSNGLDEATKDVTELLLMLAINEDWQEREVLEPIVSAMGRSHSEAIKEVLAFKEKYPDDKDIQEFSPEIYDEGRERIHVSKHQASLYRYFKEKKLEIPPVTSQGRWRKLNEFRENVPPNYEAAFLLFNEETDADNVDFLLSLGVIHYDNINNPFHSYQKAKELFLRAAALGSAVAMRNIGVGYVDGIDGFIDLDLAQEWYGRAVEYGYVEANFALASLIIQFDPEYNKSEETDKKIYKLIQEACEQEYDLQPHFKHAKLMLTGRGCDYNPAAILAYVQISDSLEGKTDNNSVALKNDIFCLLGIRSYLGLSVTEDNSAAVSYLGKITDKVNSTTIKHQLYPQIQKFLNIINEDDDTTSSIKKLIHSLYREPQAQLEFMATIENQVLDTRKQKKKPDVSRHKIDMFWMVYQLALKEGWKDVNSWQRIVRSLHAARYGLTYKDIESSTMTEGPRYNEIDNGAPVLGDIATPPVITENNKLDQKSFVPPAGIYGITGLVAEDNGGIHFNFLDAPAGTICPARILKEDIDVALVLAFSNASGAIEPYLSLEGGGHKELQKNQYPYRDNFDNFEDPHNLFMYKVWNPTWLGHTSFGRTMYIVDNLLTICSSYAKNFSVVEKKDEKSQILAELSRDIVRDIVFAGGKDPVHESSRVMNVPDHIAAVPEEYIVEGKRVISVSLPQIKIMVEGSYIIGENRRIAKDDPQYAIGRQTQKISQRFTDLCQIMPVYHRYQQIMGLQHALSTLRNQNFKPHPDFMRDIQRNYEYYNSLPPVPNNELLSIHLPFTP